MNRTKAQLRKEIKELKEEITKLRGERKRKPGGPELVGGMPGRFIRPEWLDDWLSVSVSIDSAIRQCKEGMCGNEVSPGELYCDKCFADMVGVGGVLHEQKFMFDAYNRKVIGALREKFSESFLETVVSEAPIRTGVRKMAPAPSEGYTILRYERMTHLELVGEIGFFHNVIDGLREGNERLKEKLRVSGEKNVKLNSRNQELESFRRKWKDMFDFLKETVS